MVRLADDHDLTPASKVDVQNATMTMQQYLAGKAREKAERDRVLALRDMAYRQALGLPLDGRLPAALGSATGGRHKAKTALRGTKVPEA